MVHAILTSKLIPTDPREEVKYFITEVHAESTSELLHQLLFEFDSIRELNKTIEPGELRTFRRTSDFCKAWESYIDNDYISTAYNYYDA